MYVEFGAVATIEKNDRTEYRRFKGTQLQVEKWIECQLAADGFKEFLVDSVLIVEGGRSITVVVPSAWEWKKL